MGARIVFKARELTAMVEELDAVNRRVAEGLKQEHRERIEARQRMGPRDFTKENIQRVTRSNRGPILDEEDQNRLARAQALNSAARFYDSGPHGHPQHRTSVEYKEEIHEVAFPSRTQVRLLALTLHTLRSSMT